jgi:hypothetical protein
MNVFDNSLLFEMSYAPLRRFAFIEVPSPSDEVFLSLIERESGGGEVAVGLTSKLFALRRSRSSAPGSSWI